MKFQIYRSLDYRPNREEMLKTYILKPIWSGDITSNVDLEKAVWELIKLSY